MCNERDLIAIGANDGKVFYKDKKEEEWKSFDLDNKKEVIDLQIIDFSD